MTRSSECAREKLIAVGYPKRLAVDGSSRVVLGLPESDDADIDPAELRPDVTRLAGDVGAVTRVVLPSYVAGAALALVDLEPRAAAFDALLANTLNLDRVGQPALDALCDLARDREGPTPHPQRRAPGRGACGRHLLTLVRSAGGRRASG